MGSRIPEFVTRQLASSVTGTTGIDNSRSKMFGAISSGAAQVFKATAAFAAERQRVTQFVEADKLQKEYELGAEKSVSAIQKEFADDPSSSVEAFDKLSTEALNDSLSTINSPRLQAMVSQRISSTNRTIRKGLKKWASDQEVRNAGVNLTAVDNMEAGILQTDPNPSIEKWAMSMGEHETRKSMYDSVYSPENAVKGMNRGRTARTKGFLYSMMREAPAEGLSLLDSGMFSKFLSTQEFDSMHDQLESSVKGFSEQAKFDQKVVTLKNHNSAEILIRQNKLDPAAVTKLQDDEEEANGKLSFERKESYKDLMKIATENVDKTAVESQAVRIRLQDHLRSLNVATDKRTSGAQLEQISGFMHAVNRAHAKGEIGGKFREKLLNNVTTPFNEQLQAEEGDRGTIGFLTFGYFGKPSSPYDAGYLKAQDWLDERGFSDKVGMDAKDNILNGMLDRVDDATQTGQILTDALVESFVETEIQSELFRQSPKLRNIPAKGMVVTLDGGKGDTYRIMPDYSFTLLNQ
jgi:hypothetical protein